jgi:hypothetical protein
MSYTKTFLEEMVYQHELLLTVQLTKAHNSDLSSQISINVIIDPWDWLMLSNISRTAQHLLAVIIPPTIATSG